MGMLELQVSEDAVFVHYTSESNSGGYLGRVVAGGKYLGLEYSELRELGTGNHECTAEKLSRRRQSLGCR
jgi:hypothetical protein